MYWPRIANSGVAAFDSPPLDGAVSTNFSGREEEAGKEVAAGTVKGIGWFCVSGDANGEWRPPMEGDGCDVTSDAHLSSTAFGVSRDKKLFILKFCCEKISKSWGFIVVRA